MAALPFTKPHLNVAVHLLKSLAQLLNLVCLAFNPAGEVADLLLETVHSDLQIDGGVAAAYGTGRRLAAAVVDLTLQHAEIPFQPVEALSGRSILGSGRWDGRDCDEHAQRSRVSSG